MPTIKAVIKFKPLPFKLLTWKMKFKYYFLGYSKKQILDECAEEFDTHPHRYWKIKK